MTRAATSEKAVIHRLENAEDRLREIIHGEYIDQAHELAETVKYLRQRAEADIDE